MPNVVVVGGIIQCSHGGQIQFSSGSSQLEVSGSQAITSGMEAGLSFALGAPGVTTQCPEQTTTTPPSPAPCTSSPADAGVSTLLLIGGGGVLLDSATGPAINPVDPSATWSIASANQTLLQVAE